MKPKYAAFSALDPFFEVVQRGLSGLVDGEHYFDTIAKNAIFEFRYDIAGWPKRVESRDALMALYRGYRSASRAICCNAQAFTSAQQQQSKDRPEDRPIDRP